MTVNQSDRLQYTQQAKNIVQQMTLDEKIHIMSANETLLDYIKGNIQKVRYNETPYEAGGCSRLNVPVLKFCDGPRGVVSGRSTCFPVAMGRGATFDPELERQVGQAIGAEVRAHGANFFAGICLNLPYHPGDGRSQETFSEDSHHIGKMGAALVQGVQSQNVAACIKHYAFNSMECSRFKVDVTADKRTEQEVYLPHFKACIDAGAAALMTSYNKYKGSYCGHHKYLIRDIAKGEWGFDGPVMSDFLVGVRDTAGGIAGGLDIEMRICRVYSKRRIKKQLRRGIITMAMIDDAALRIVRTLIAFQNQKDPHPYPAALIGCKEHIALARKVAEQSITLIKNEDLLPLKKSIKKLVVAGDLANTENIGDHGSSRVTPAYVTTLYQAVQKEYPGVECTWCPTAQVESQKAKIAGADAVVMVCGYRHCDEGEFMPQRKTDRGGDRQSLELHAPERAMIDHISQMNPNSAVILMGGNAILTHSWQQKVKAVLFAYYPGMEGGGAMADILFGKVNPSGKLPFAIAASEKSYPAIVWDTDHQHYGYYHGYQKLEKEGLAVDYPFGFGLSYTSFALTNARLVKAQPQTADFAVTLANTGGLAGGEVVQLYIGWNESAVDRPCRSLKGFKKVFLEPGQSKEVHFSVEKQELAYYSEQASDWVLEDINYTAYLGTNQSQSAQNPVGFRFTQNRAE